MTETPRREPDPLTDGGGLPLPYTQGDPLVRPETAPTPVAMPARRRPGRRVPAWTLVLTLLAIVALAVPLAMLTWSRSTWETENAELREQVESLTAQLSDANAQLSDLATTQAQLEELKEQYSAQVDDGVSASEVEQELGDVIDAYQQCVDAQQDHFEVLRNADRYVASSVDESETSILAFCTEVTDAYLRYQESRG